MVQLDYDINPQVGFVGAIAYGHGPDPVIDLMPIQVPASGRNPRPGDAVYWDTTNNGLAVPTSADETELTCGIITYYPGQVADTLTATPTGANSPQFVEYEDGEIAPVLVSGAIWLLAGAALEYAQSLWWERTNFDWEQVGTQQPTALNTVYRTTVYCAQTSVADGDVFVGRIVGRNW